VKSFQSQTHYEVLEISVSASADEVKSAYERLSRLYGDDQVVLYGMVEGGRAAALRARLKEALEVLTDDERRDRYDVSIGLPPRDVPVVKKVPPPRTSAPAAGAAASAATGWGSFAWVSPPGGPTPSAPTGPLSYTVPAPATVLAQPPAPAPVAAAAPVAAVPVSSPAVVDPTVARVVQPPAPPPAVGLGLRLLSDPVTLAATALPVPVPPEPAPSVPAPVPVVASPAPELTRAEPAPTPPPLAPLPPIAAPRQPAPPPEPVSAAPVATEPAAAPQPSTPASAGEGAAVSPPPDDTPRLAEDVEVSIVPARTNSREFRIEQRPKPYEVPSGVEFNGDLLRQVRMARGLSLAQLSERTRIGLKHLENVEGDRYDALPAGVYLRGILMNLARELGLDGLRVSKSYLTFVEAHRSKG
jgi:hypothetical protein